MEDPILTERLRLRPFTDDDLDAVHAMWAEPEVGRWVGGTHERMAESIDELKGHLQHQARHGFAFWAAEERDTGAFAGEVGLQHFEGRGPEIEIGWCFARPMWGRGYATEAAGAWLRTGFDDLGFERIVAVVVAENAASRRVCDRLGMRETGRRRAYGADHLEYVIERSAPRAGVAAAR